MSDAMPILLGPRFTETISQIRKAGATEVVIAIPWAMIERCDAQAHINHSQSLKRLADRGGLSHCEAVAILEGRRWYRMPVAEANARLSAMLADWKGAPIVER